jgi:hypothetical protein
MTTVWLYDQLDAALKHAENVWPHNSIAIEDPLIDDAVQRAINCVTLWPDDKGYPDVRVIYPCVDGLGYHAERVNGPEWIFHRHMHRAFTGWCGRGMCKVETQAVLYVPAGMTIVAVELCPVCVRHMRENYSPLRWM